MNYLSKDLSVQSQRRFRNLLLNGLLFFLIPSMGGHACLISAARAGMPQQVSSTNAEKKTILFLGDSLTEGYGVAKEEAFPEIVGRLLNERGLKVKIVNGGISGSVSAEADRRLNWFLKIKPDFMVLALGGNDALKGTSVKVIKSNLARAIDLAHTNGIRVLLCGIKVYSNLGQDYEKELSQMFLELSREKKVPLMPFLLVDVALKKELNQADMKHPNSKGHAVIGRNLAKELEKQLEKRP